MERTKSIAAVALLLLVALFWGLGISPPSPEPAPSSPPPSTTAEPDQPTDLGFDTPAPSSPSAEVTVDADDPEPTDDPPLAIIKGHIWRTDGVSLEGSRVVLYAPGRPGSEIDAEGFFEMTTELVRGLTLALEHEGTTMLLDVDVRPLPGEEVVLEIEVDPGHEIAVETIDKRTKRPIPELKVALRHATFSGQAELIVGQTDALGLVEFSLLPEGDYRLEIDDDNYQPATASLRAPGGPPHTIELEPAARLRIVLDGYADHPPQERVLFFLSAASGQGSDSEIPPTLSGSPDEDGSFIARSPGPGTWNFQVLGSANFPRFGGSFEVPTPDPNSSAIPTVTIALPPPGDVTVVGRLLDEAGNPIAGGAIHFDRASAPVDQNGEYAVAGVKVGPSEPRWIRGTGNDRIERALGPLEIPDQYVFEHDFTIVGTGQLTMSVEALPQEMLAGLFAFSVERIDGGVPAHSSYGVRGAHQKLTLDHLPHGLYRVQPTIAHRGVILLSSEEVEVGDEPIELVVEYRDPATWSFEFEFPPGVEPPSRVIAVIERDDHYVDTYFFSPGTEPVSQESYLDGDYQWTFKAAGCQDVVQTLTIEPETERSKTIRFEPQL